MSDRALELSLGVGSDLVDAIAEAVAARLASQMQQVEAGEPWRLWDLAETAGRLGRSERWVRERANRGDLPRIKLDGGALAFDPEDVRAFAWARRVPLASEDNDRRLRAIP